MTWFYCLRVLNTAFMQSVTDCTLLESSAKNQNIQESENARSLYCSHDVLLLLCHFMVRFPNNQ